MKKFLSIYLVFLWGTLVFPAVLFAAGKKDQVVEAVKKTCNETIPDTELVSAVVKAFDCQPGKDVVLKDTCTIKCLKEENSGNVVGK